MYRPNGQRFLSPVELDQRAEAAVQRADIAEQRAEAAVERADIAEQRAEQEKLRADRLAARLRDLGIDLNLTRSTFDQQLKLLCRPNADALVNGKKLETSFDSIQFVKFR